MNAGGRLRAMRRRHALPLALGLLLLASLPAGAAELACPPFLELRPADAIVAPPGWQGEMRPQRHALAAADLFVGDPAKLAQLRGEDRDYPRLVFWPLPREAEGYTLVCRYEGTEAVLQARVPEEARRCEVRSQAETTRLLRGERTVTLAQKVQAACR